MSDLQRLTESLVRAIEQAEHKPGQWAGTAQSMGGICCPGEPFDSCKPIAKEDRWAGFSYKRDAWLAVAAVNALPQLLGELAGYQMGAKAEADAADEARAEVRLLKVELARLRPDPERARYWKQRAKSAEGHLFSSDFRAAARELHRFSSLESTPWDELESPEQARIYAAAGRVIAVVNARRDERRPVGAMAQPPMVDGTGEAQQLQGAGHIQVCKLGMHGQAYDAIGASHRAYTYTEQPGNQAAYKLGRALTQAAKDGGGDFIDAGLALLNHLQEQGFGVFEIAGGDL